MEDGSTIRQDQPSHVHTNWLFTQPGLYTMEVQAKATPVSGAHPFFLTWQLSGGW